METQQTLLHDSNDEVALEDELQALMERNDLMVKENDILTAYLYRCKQNIIEREQGEDAEPFSSDHLQVSGHDTLRALAQRDKMEAILHEEASIEEDLRQIQEHAHKDVQSLKEVLEEARLRSNEIKKDAYEFRRDVVIGADSMQTGKIEAEKVVNHIEEKLKNKEILIEKLKAKNTSLKGQILKYDAQLKQKDELGDSLHRIDFEQLQIENSQYNQKIEERNKELLKLKMTTGRTVQILNAGKRELANFLSESSRLKRELADRKEQIHRLSSELERVQKEVERSKRVKKRYEEKLQSLEMPQIVDYVKQKMEETSLQSVLNTWRRKVEIAEVGARRYGSRLQTVRNAQRLLKQKAARERAELAERNAHVQLEKTEVRQAVDDNDAPAPAPAPASAVDT